MGRNPRWCFISAGNRLGMNSEQDSWQLAGVSTQPCRKAADPPGEIAPWTYPWYERVERELAGLTQSSSHCLFCFVSGLSLLQRSQLHRLLGCLASSLQPPLGKPDPSAQRMAFHRRLKVVEDPQRLGVQLVSLRWWNWKACLELVSQGRGLEVRETKRMQKAPQDVVHKAFGMLKCFV